jgi:hydroxymethylbilane synthase
MRESAASLKRIRIGTRGSPLALTQARMFADLLTKKFPDIETEIVPIRASGDETASTHEQPLYNIGGKGLFTKELEAALKAGQVDVAVHSMKDVPARLDDEFTIACALPREDPRDAFVSKDYLSPDQLPEGAVVGTTSPRRRAQVMRRWPQVKVVPLRGNVDTRLKKLAEGQVAATFLAYAGLKRLGRAQEAVQVMSLMPCANQGIVGVEILKTNAPLALMLQSISHLESYICMQAERAMLKVLDGSCDTAIGALALIEDNQIILDGIVYHPDGKDEWRASGTASLNEAEQLGEKLGQELRAKTPKGILP